MQILVFPAERKKANIESRIKSRENFFFFFFLSNGFHFSKNSPKSFVRRGKKKEGKEFLRNEIFEHR